MFANSRECDLWLCKSPVSRWKCENDQRVRSSTAACLTEGLLRRQLRPTLACCSPHPQGRRLHAAKHYLQVLQVEGDVLAPVAARHVIQKPAAHAAPLR